MFNENNEFLPVRVVVTIPNNFTSTQTKDMISCVQASGNFKEIRYITESEAILFYYINQYSKLRPKIDTGLEDETVLVFDMGGATINTTIGDVVFRSQQKPPVYEINLDSKLGYGVGGDTIDYCLITAFINLLDCDFVFSSHNNKHDKDYRKTTLLNEVIIELKIKIINRYYKEDLQIHSDIAIGKYDTNEKLKESIYTSILLRIEEIAYFAEQLTGDILPEESLIALWKLFWKDKNGEYPIFNTPSFQKFIYEPIKDVINETLQLSFGGGGFIDTVIFSGRSCQFPLIQETVKDVLSSVKKPAYPKQSICPVYITLDSQELKTAVAKGACWYGINRNAV